MYGDVVSLQQNREPKFFQERAILCPTNEDVNMINQHMLDKLLGSYITLHIRLYYSLWILLGIAIRINFLCQCR